MALVLKKKPVQSVAQEDDLTPRKQEALDLVGLSPAPKLTIKKKLNYFPKDTKVVVTNKHFFWVQSYKPGDTGVVLKHFHAVTTPLSESPRDDLYLVKMDTPRIEGKEELLFSRWELEALE